VVTAGAERVRVTGSADVKACSGCQGLGEVTYEYHHREMKRSCDQCSGEGCFVLRDGVKQAAAATSDAPERLSAGRSVMTPQNR